MNPSTIIARARKGIVDTNNYPDSDWILDFNFVYQDLISEIITELDEDYFFNIAKAPTVIWQEEYVIKEVWSTTKYKVNEINKVAVKFSSSDTQYTPCTRVNPNDLEHDTDWYKVNQPKTNPFYYVQDNSVWIYPVATENVTDGLKINVIYQPNDLTISSAESEILITPRFHHVIVSGIRPYIYQSRGKVLEETDAINKYEVAKKNMITKMKNRNQWVIEVTYPNLTNYT